MCDEQEHTLGPSSRTCLLGFAAVRLTSGAARMHGFSLRVGGPPVACRALALLGPSLLLEAGPAGAVLRLRPLCAADGCVSLCSAPDGAAAGHAPCVPPDWASAASSVAASATSGARVVVLVCGPSRSGKSTLVRLLLNTLLSNGRAPLLVDVDCGAPECTPPGLVSVVRVSSPLLGPPALRLACSDAPAPTHSRFVGDVSPKGDGDAYAAAVAQLISAALAEAHATAAPVVINTCGWVRGTGLRLLAHIASCAAPSLVIQMGGVTPHAPLVAAAATQAHPCAHLVLSHFSGGGGVGENDTWDGGDDGGEGGDAPPRRPHPNPPPPPRAPRAAADARGALWVAWAHAACASLASPTGAASAASDSLWADAWVRHGGGEHAAAADAAGALARARPLCVRASTLPCFALFATDVGSLPGVASRVLNGALVGLASSPRGQCCGAALVRSVDVAKGLLYIIPPPGGSFASPTGAWAPGGGCGGANGAREGATPRVLLVGRLELPPALLRPDGLCSPYLAAHAIAGEGTGGGAMRSRNNLQRGTTGGGE